jgi:esterase/lipase superfamily enzyme/TRAP-type C4-dicarboxylate transport system substrate-binding protein
MLGRLAPSFFFFMMLISAQSAQGQTLEIRLATLSPPGTPVWRGSEAYRDAVNRMLDGIARVELLPGATPDALDLVRAGKIQMAVVPSVALASGKAQSLALLDLPFFFRDLREVAAVQQSLIGEMMLGSVNEERVLMGLAYWNTGMSQLFGSKPILEANHLKGIKFRTTVSGPARVAAEALGTSPTSIAAGEVGTALNQGAIELVEVPALFVAQKVVPLEPTNFSNVNYRPVVSVLVANTNFWRDARLRVQAVLADQARAVAERIDQDAQESERSSTELLSRQFKFVQVSQGQFEGLSKEAEAGWQKVSALQAGGFLQGALYTRNELRRVNYDVPRKRSEPAPRRDGRKVVVRFVTDRYDDKAREPDPSLRFTGKRGGQLAYGDAEVVFDPKRPHASGDVKMVTLASIVDRPKQADFAAAIAQDTAQFNEVLLYVHGYWTSFERAIKSAAQIAADINFQGPVLAFSWPSNGTGPAYFLDEEAVEDSRDNLVALLGALSGGGSTLKIHIVTHSMGGRLASSAAEWIHTQPADKRPKLYHLILAAPDVRIHQFERALPGMLAISNRVTLYASEWDQALRCSQTAHGDSVRVGQGGRNVQVFASVDTVDVSEVEKPTWWEVPFICTSSGHSYISQNQAVLADLYTLVVNNRSPKDRQRLHEQKKGTLPYWLLK